MYRYLRALLYFAVFSSAPAFASDEAEVRLRLSIGRDEMHSPGSIAIVGHYGGSWGVTAAYWAHDSTERPSAPNLALGGDYAWTWRDWRYGGGVVWIDQTDEINGTHWNFELLVAYDFSRHFYAELTHYSHGSDVGIKRDVPNAGWNFLGLGYAF